MAEFGPVEVPALPGVDPHDPAAPHGGRVRWITRAREVVRRGNLTFRRSCGRWRCFARHAVSRARNTPGPGSGSSGWDASRISGALTCGSQRLGWALATSDRTPSSARDATRADRTSAGLYRASACKATTEEGSPSGLAACVHARRPRSVSTRTPILLALGRLRLAPGGQARGVGPWTGAEVKATAARSCTSGWGGVELCRI